METKRNSSYTTGRQYCLWSMILHAVSKLQTFLFALLPSIINYHWSGKTVPARPIHSTSYLNGIRGIAAFLVFIRHFSVPWQSHVDYGYGEKGHFEFLRLPFLRILYAGPLVPVLLVLSGYVMSLKPLKTIRNGSLGKLLATLSRSVFSRAMRLFLPPIVSTFAVMIAVRLDLFFSPETVPGRKPQHPVKLPTIWNQLIDWTQFVSMELTNPFTWNMDSPLKYGQHLWTIPVTFRGSLVVLLVLLGLSSVRSLHRICLVFALTLYCFCMARWELSLFLGGIIMCEISLIQQEQQYSMESINDSIERTNGCKRTNPNSWKYRILRAFCLMGALYLGSFPRYNNGEGTCVVGYQLLCSFTADYRYWDALAGLGILGVLLFGEEYHMIFNTTFPQYLSTISFSFYIIHEPFLQIVGFPILQLVWKVVGDETWLMYQVGFSIGMLITGLLLLWAAELFARFVEQPCGNLAELIYTNSLMNY